MNKLFNRSIIFLIVISFLFFLPSPAYAWKFAVYGDTRSRDETHREVLKGILNKIPNSERVTLFNTGDITLDGCHSQWEVWKKAVEDVLGTSWLTNNPPQYIGAVGNHDSHGSEDCPSDPDTWQERWANYLPGQIGLSAYPGVDGHPSGLYGSFKYNNALWVWLDSDNNRDPDSYPNDPQNVFIRETLEAGNPDNDPEVQWRFVFYHHPPIPCGNKDDRSLEKKWHDQYFVPNGVDIAFEGHAHYFNRTCPFTSASSKTCDRDNRGSNIGDSDGVIHVIAGGGGAPTYDTDCTKNLVCPSCSCSCSWVEAGAKKHHFVEVSIEENIMEMITWETDSNSGNNPQKIDQLTITKETSSPTATPTPTNTCANRSSGDVNCDEVVNILDLVLVGANFGTDNAQADANQDGTVNIVDLVLVGANFGNSF